MSTSQVDKPKVVESSKKDVTSTFEAPLSSENSQQQPDANVDANVDAEASSATIKPQPPVKTSGNTIALISFLVIVGSIAGAFFYSSMKPNYRELFTKDEALMKEVIFSGQPWLVYCSNGVRHRGYGEKEMIWPSQMETMARYASSVPDLNLGVIDCLSTFKSGKTIMERFDLEIPQGRNKPLGFFTVNRNTPKSIPERFAKPSIAKKDSTVLEFVNYLTRETTARMYQIKTQKDLQTQCISRRNCVLTVINKKDQLSFLNQYIKKYRFISFGVLDASYSALNFNDVEQAVVLDPVQITTTKVNNTDIYTATVVESKKNESESESSESIPSIDIQSLLKDFDQTHSKRQQLLAPGFRDEQPESFPKLFTFQSAPIKVDSDNNPVKPGTFQITMNQMKYPATSLAPWTIDSFLTESLGPAKYGAYNRTEAAIAKQELYPNTESYIGTSVNFIGIPKVVSSSAMWEKPVNKIEEARQRREMLREQKRREAARTEELEKQRIANAIVEESENGEDGENNSKQKQDIEEEDEIIL